MVYRFGEAYALYSIYTFVIYSFNCLQMKFEAFYWSIGEK